MATLGVWSHHIGSPLGSYIPIPPAEEEALRDIAFISSGVDITGGATNPIPWDSTFIMDIGGTFDLFNLDNYLYTAPEAGSYKVVLHLRLDIFSLVTSTMNEFLIQLHSNNSTAEEVYFFTKNFTYSIPTGSSTEQFYSFEYVTFFRNVGIGDKMGFDLDVVHDVGTGVPNVYLNAGSLIEVAKIG